MGNARQAYKGGKQMGKFTYPKTSTRDKAMKTMKAKGWKVKKDGKRSFTFHK